MKNYSNAIEEVAIGEFCRTGSGGTPSRNKADRYFGGGIPWVKSGELRESIITETEETITPDALNESAAKLLPRDTLLVALYGATVGRIGILGIEAATNQAVCYIIPDETRADKKYLYYALQSKVPHWLSKRVGGGQPNISQGIIKDTLIPLLPLSEQKQIADILDKADAIRRKRRSALGSIEEVIQSTFMHTVASAADDYSLWPNKKIQELVAGHKGAMRTGPFGSTLKHSEFVDSGVAVLGIDNAVTNRFAWGQRRFISSEKYEDLKAYTVHPGDVLITIMATTGRSAVVPDDVPLAINTKHLACITLDRRMAESEFISQAIHRHPVVLTQLDASGRGAIMNGLNLGIIKQIKIPIPPIELQREFASKVARLRRLESRLQAASNEGENLFNSLVQRAFKGEL